MLLIGNGCLTTAEEQTQMAILAIVAALLIMGNDLRNISAASKAILLNKDAIAITLYTPLTHNSHSIPHL
jgi:alpha-galactosidase